MRQAIISDTHSNKWTEKAFESVCKYKDKLEIDSVVYNGDLIGHFSLAKSNVHRNQRISQEQLDDYLREAAPNFYKKWKSGNTITKSMVYEFVGERYSWIVKFLRKSSEELKTIWNLGNHESKHHFLVLNEIPFLTGSNHKVVENIDENILTKIYELYLKKIKDLERTHNFHYIGDKHVILNDSLLIGIPGQSHSTVGMQRESQIQEAETKRILSQAKEHFEDINTIIIYNHTQGNYLRELSLFQPASKAAKKFMKELPKSIKNKIFIQSHNHWSYTQVLQPKDFLFILNNAGLHGGIYNILDVDNEINIFDVDPIQDEISKLKISDKYGSEFVSEEKKIERNYSDVSKIITRKTRHQNK